MDKKIKGANRRYLLKLRLAKVSFYPLLIFLDKIGLRKLLTRPIDSISHLFGIGKSINEFFKYKEHGRLFRNNFNNVPSSGEVLLFPAFFGVNSNYTMLNLLFSKYFLEDNVKPVFLVCRASVPVCQKENVFKTRKHNPFICHECHKGYRQLSKDTGINIVYPETFIDDDDKLMINSENRRIEKLSSLEQCMNYSFKEIPVGQYTLKTVLRFFLKGSITGTEYELEIFRKYLQSTVIMIQVHEKLFKKNEKIKYSIIHNGTLVFETITRLYCEKQNIPYITYENYMGKNTIIYRKNGEIMNFEWNEEFKNFRVEESFYPEMKEKVSQLFAELQAGKHAFGVLNKGKDSSEDSGQKEYVCLFTNVNFDTAVIGKHTIFNDMTDWLRSVVEYWTENVKDIQLVIRVHPAEIVLKSASQEFMGDFLKGIVKSSNITIIDSTDKMNSYNLISGMKYGLVYSSTIGMEIAYRNKACVVAGKPYYRGKEFVISPESRSEYFDIIGRLNNGNFDFKINQDELLRFIYFVFYKRLKYLNGIVIYTLNSEPNTTHLSSDTMYEANKAFLSEFKRELTDPHYR